MKGSKKFLVGAALLASAMAAPASASTIILTDVGGVTGSAAERGFRAAAHFWETQLTNNVTINLNVGYSALGAGILGSTSSTRYYDDASAIYGQLAASGNSALDAIAVANLSPLVNGSLAMVTPGYVDPVAKTGVNTNTAVLDFDGSANNSYINGTSANLKALGYTLPTGPDATIRFSSNFAFDFTPTDGIDAGKYDFIGVAIHEIGHALGFTSGVDTYDLYGCPSGPYCGAGSGLNFNNYAIGNVMDLFRYSQPAVLDWKPDDEVYFSIDGGATELFGNGNDSTGRYNGDGNQASHWKANGTCSNFIGVMNPYLCSGRGATVTSSDLGVFDAIGWNTKVDVLADPNFRFTSAQAFMGVPEPATWMQMILGFGFIGGMIRRTRRRPVAALS